MKRVMLAAVAILLLAALPLAAAEWTTDYNSALQTAKAQNRAVLINFTGSDWCGWCIRLKKEVFDTAEFGQFAGSRLVLVEADFPQNKRLSSAQQRANQELQQKFRVTGYPSLFLVDGNGKILQKLGYMPGGPKAFIGEMTKVIGEGGGQPGQTTQNGWIVGQAAAAPAPASLLPPEPEPAVAPTGPAAKVVYDKLILKGITGSANKPMALINNKTFAPGDAYKVQVGADTLKVSCVSIAGDHVMVQVEGEKEPRKLALGTK